MWLTEGCQGCQEPQVPAGDSLFLLQVNSEYYTGWLDYWGEAHASTSSARVARGLEDMLQLGANVNMQVVSWGCEPLLSASTGVGIAAHLLPTRLGRQPETASAAGRGKCPRDLRGVLTSVGC